MNSTTISKISIITPSYNQAAFISETLESIKRQGYPNLEHIVVDGGSTDGTVDILRDYAARPGWQHLRWISERDRGQTDAINKGLRMATGDIYAYLCSDDLYADDALKFANEYFQSHSEVDLIYGSCSFINDSGKLLRVKRAVPFSRSKLLRGNFIWQPTVFFRAQVWSTVGEFNEKLQFAMDYEYWLRVSMSCRMEAVDKNLATYRLQADSKTVSQQPRQLREAYEVATEHDGGGPVSWYLHRLYWPYTARAKRWFFEQTSSLKLFR